MLYLLRNAGNRTPELSKSALVKGVSCFRWEIVSKNGKYFQENTEKTINVKRQGGILFKPPTGEHEWRKLPLASRI